MPTLALMLAAGLLALSTVGCGGDDDAETTVSESAEIRGGADPEAVAVIDGWSSALSEGDVEAAADFFELPSVAQNGTPPIDLENRDDVIAFNEALPCGAELVEASEQQDIIVATFELTDRPGGACGPGVGGSAKTAFVIEDGKIVEWRRAVDEPVVEPPADSPVV